MTRIRPCEPDAGRTSPDHRRGDAWSSIAEMFRTSACLPPPWEEQFGPLRTGTVDDLVVVAQIGQSLDGRIATLTGHSHYINGPAGRAHLHRLRSLVDAVVIGIGTALADDPQLTVRLVSGPHPARVVVDARGRLPAQARILDADGARRLVVTTAGTQPLLPSGVEIVALDAVDGHIAPAAILSALADRGLRRILIEGGADTVSRFVAAGCLDRMHVLVAPLILGAGRSSLALAPTDRIEDAPRVSMRAYVLDDELLLDCDLSAQRVAIGRAKMSR